LIIHIIIFSGCDSYDKTVVETVKVVEGVSNKAKTNLDSDAKAESVMSIATNYYNTYNITLNINSESRIISGVEKVAYKNNTGKDLSKIYFHVYSNAFIPSSKKQPYFEEYKEEMFKYGNNSGFTDIKYIYINNNEVKFEQNDTILKVNLPHTLKAGEKTEITLQFESYVPKIASRTGANDRGIWLGNYIPSLCVYDDSGWRTDSYYAEGDPFYSDISNYKVEVTTPKEYKVIGTGEESETDEKAVKVTTINAEMVRDFAMAISPNYSVKTLKTKKGVNINFYYYSDEIEGIEGIKDIDNIDEKLSLAEKTIDYYSKKLGSYPYTELDIVENELFDEIAIDYPAFIMMDSMALKNSLREDTLVEAIGQQWFYNVIGSDQINEAWLDEGLNAYMQEGVTQNYLDQRVTLQYKILEDKLATLSKKTLDISLGEYEDWTSYYYTQNLRAKLMIYSLNQKMGDEGFNTLLKTYYKRYAFKIATSQDFIALAEEIYGKSLKVFFKEWITDEQLPKLVIGGNE